MKKKILFRFIIQSALLLIPAAICAQEIENIRPQVVGDRIYIHYDLLGIPADQPVIVRIFVSTDGGETYGEPLKSVSGDVGLVLGPGKDRQIIWDVFEEVDELVSDNVKFMIKADPLRPDEGRGTLKPGYAANVNAELGQKVNRSAYGFNLKASILLKQLGLGVRGLYYRNLGANNREGYYWGFSGGAVIDYDFLRNPKYSLYPFMYVGQTKILYVQDGLNSEHSGYSIFYSPGVGFNIRISKFMYLGAELEYYMAPRIDLVDRGSNSVVRNIIMDGFSVGIVLKFVKLPD